MDAMQMLYSVAETYANLQSLAVEILSISESGDEDSSSHTEQRSRAFFVAPDKVRIEQGGSRGMIIVTNGIDSHTYFHPPKRYAKTRSHGPDLLPGSFRPEFPIAGSPASFLFRRIAERVARAEIVREEPLTLDGSSSICQLVSVSYEPSPHPSFTISSSPVTFWIDSRTRLVVRMEGETTHRMPAQNETHTERSTLVFRPLANEAIPPETFEYTPPVDAIDASDPRGRGVCGTSGGGGYSEAHSGRRFENWHSHDWAGETLIERSRYKWNDVTFTIERRLTFSEDRKTLAIAEKVASPKGETSGEFSLPVA